MEKFNDFLLLLDANLSGSWWFPAFLIGTGIFFTIYLRFPQFRYFKSALKIVSGKNETNDADGETTGFQALTTAMSGAVGTGNIGGVALALIITLIGIANFKFLPTMISSSHSSEPSDKTTDS